MPQLSYAVSHLQQQVEQATVSDLVHANNVLNMAKKSVQQGHRQKNLDWGPDLIWEVQHSHPKEKPRRIPKDLGFAAIHDASFMGQPKEGSQSAYCLMLCSTKLYEGKVRTHLIDWG